MRLSLIGSGLCALAVLALAAPAKADPTVIDFSGAPAGDYLSYSTSGVTFTAVTGGLLTSDNLGPTPNGTRGIVGQFPAPLPEIRADFAGLASFVSVDLGDYNSDPDGLFLEAYDSLDNLLASSVLLIPADFIGMETLSVNAVDIAYVIFGARTPSVSGSSVYADNFTFDATGGTADVPEPGAFAMLAGAGVVGLGLTRRRK